MATEKIDEDLWEQCRVLIAEDLPSDPVYPQWLGVIDDLKIMLVDGEKVKVSSLDMMDFHEAGNGYGWEVGLIPKDEVWIDSTTKSAEYPFNLYHELFEIRLMKKGLSYEAAHDRANKAEMILRKRAMDNRDGP